MAKKAIRKTTRDQIKAFLEVFVEHLVSRYRGQAVPSPEAPTAYLSKTSAKGRLKPFHAAIIPPELMRVSTFERGFSTALGTTFEECARLIALDHHEDAQRGYTLTGKVSLAALAEIESQVAALDEAVTGANLLRLWCTCFSAYWTPAGTMTWDRELHGQTCTFSPRTAHGYSLR